MTATLTPQTLAEWLDDGAELAIVDIRPADQLFYYGAPLHGTSLPADRVEAELIRTVPRKAVRTVLVDGGDGVAATLAEKLAGQGWTSLHALEGGFPAWEASPYAKTHTHDIPGKDFSLAIKAERDTPVTTVEELKEARERGEDVIVIDTRTVPEFARNHVPGAVSVPGAELLLRFTNVVPDPKTRVVVSCAGLPRAILGAQTLIDGHVPNPVSFLWDGTAAWKRAGWDLEEGLTAQYGPATEESRAFGREHIAKLPTAGQFPEIDLNTAQAWAADPDRTTYLLDVRTPEEYEAGHIEGSLSAEGGQLLGLSSRTIATRGARLVLIDDADGIRAATVANFLHRRRNFEIAILRHAFAAAPARAEAEAAA